ncbi:MAG: phosphopyruvate hydratase [Pseudomonadota bacterium]|nr:phosphopyruvate hydratase [Pseudomonadota bacterium]
MKEQEIISKVSGYEILDSRGNPTVAAEITLNDGRSSMAFVPSGASTGKYEAHEKRDEEESRYLGKGVKKAISSIDGEINELLRGRSTHDQIDIDKRLCELDGTSEKNKIGANAILAVSLAVARSSSTVKGQPLYQTINQTFKEISGEEPKHILPIPMMNILNGGEHADNKIDFQEFMIQPVEFDSFSKALQCGVEVFHTLKKVLKEKNLSTSVGDEGGFAPQLFSAEEALDLIMDSIEIAGYKAGKEVFICLDCASSEFYKDNLYKLTGMKKDFDSQGLTEYLVGLTEKYPITSIEDGLDEDDWVGWSSLNKNLGSKVQLVGDDLFVTNKSRLQRGIKENSANSILIKVNQIGSLTEALETIHIARKNGFKNVISHRSGETEDAFIADLSVGVGAKQIKTGAPSRSDRVSKYNRLLLLEAKTDIKFAGLK